MSADKILHGAQLDPFAEELPRLSDALTRRVNADPEGVERGLAQLVLTVIELLRQLMERQAIRRTQVRHRERTKKQGSLRFWLVLLTLIATAVIVTVAMFETLYYVMG